MWEPRRRACIVTFERAQAHGEIRSGIDADLLVDRFAAPIVFRCSSVTTSSAPRSRRKSRAPCSLAWDGPRAPLRGDPLAGSGSAAATDAISCRMNACAGSESCRSLFATSRAVARSGAQHRYLTVCLRVEDLDSLFWMSCRYRLHNRYRG
ncbi:TetR-like C-terminal domain-containing protein [Pendulispora albinea]|uniref:TetR-like C-terminal domain-containing protein n=1 Tax=Pendulispora albinea TaxID=2741071 RepID=UPI00374E1624